MPDDQSWAGRAAAVLRRAVGAPVAGRPRHRLDAVRPQQQGRPPQWQTIPPPPIFTPEVGRLPRIPPPPPPPTASPTVSVANRSTQDVVPDMSPVIYRPGGRGPEKPERRSSDPLVTPGVPTAAQFSDEADDSTPPPPPPAPTALDEDPDIPDDELDDELTDELVEEAPVARAPLPPAPPRYAPPPPRYAPPAAAVPDPEWRTPAPPIAEPEAPVAEVVAEPVPEDVEVEVVEAPVAEAPVAEAAVETTEAPVTEAPVDDVVDEIADEVADEPVDEPTAEVEVAEEAVVDDEVVAGPPAALSGRVVSSRGRGLSGMTVALVDDDDQLVTSVGTGRHGEFRFDDVETGGYRVVSTDDIDGDFATGWFGGEGPEDATVLTLGEEPRDGVVVVLRSAVSIDAEVDTRKRKAIATLTVTDRATNLPSTGTITLSTDVFSVTLPLHEGQVEVTVYGSSKEWGHGLTRLPKRMKVEYSGDEHAAPIKRTVRLR